MTEYTKDDTIFVKIPSYRDSELQHTLQDLFAKAKKPENIFVGICHQYDMKEDQDKHLFEVPFPRPKQLRIDDVDYRDTKGICFARSRVQKLWHGEKWALQLDAHHRFKENWDEELVLAALNLREDGNVVISQCLPGYEKGSEEKQIDCSNRICCKKFLGTYAIYTTKDYPEKPNLTIFNYAGFVFGLAKTLCTTLINPTLESLDEVPFAVRVWTQGVNIYSYHKPVIWHYWLPEEEEKKDEARRKYRYAKHLASAIQDDLLQIKKSKNQVITNFNREYGLGDVRSLSDYERFSGISFRKKKLREFTREGVFEDWKETSRKSEIKKLMSLVDE